MNIRLTIHIKQRLIERGMSFDHIKAALRLPDKLFYSFGGRIVANKNCGEKTIEVVYLKHEYKGIEYVILTAYYL